MTRVLIVSSDRVGRRMAGPAVRCWGLAKALSKTNDVLLAVPNKTDVKSSAFGLERYDDRSLGELAYQNEVLILQGKILASCPFLAEADRFLVIDLYDPFPLEVLAQVWGERGDLQELAFQRNMAPLVKQLQVGDFFICASEKQRDFWLGMLIALGRVNPLTYGSDESLRSLIDVVPFGVEDSPPTHSENVVKGVMKGIAPTDRLILWGGGIYDWFDPITLIRSMRMVVDTQPNARLLFMGMRHPNPEVVQSRKAAAAIQLSKELKLYGSNVFFNHGWVPYDERQNYLLEADIGVSFHLDNLETRLSFRTRILDYIWAGLPIVATRGDLMAELIERHDLGRTVAVQDVEGLVEALLELLSLPDLRQRYRSKFQKVARQFAWSRVIEPLANYCREPKRAADRQKGDISIATNELWRTTDIASLPYPRGSLLSKAWYSLRYEGPGLFLRRLKSYLRWVLSGRIQ
ncbi:MAG: glycosyltransferase [Anaerolineae bacterium]